MQKKQQQELSDSQSIMATILASIPKESNITKIEYEGPRIALYTKTPRFLMENNTIISKLVNQIKKRIVIRIVASIRKNEEETRKILNDKVPKEANLQGTFFDTATGEVSIEVKRPWLCQRNAEEFNHAEISEKKAAVVSFLDGSVKKNLSPNNCREVGIQVAKLHLITKNLTGRRKNKLSINSWRKIYKNVQEDCLKIHPNLSKIIVKNLDEIENNWPKNIPSGIIHADLFPDNIFFKDNKLTGIIDFYFSCYDFYVFEIFKFLF